MRQVLKHFLRLTFGSVFVLLVFTGSAFAQHQAEINLMGAFPQGEFKDQINGGIGLSGGYTYGFFHNSPLSLRIGADGGFIIYGNETRREPFSPTIPDVVVEVETSNNIVQFGLAAKLATNRGPLRPYFEGRAGVSYFYTETKIRDVDGNDDQDIASSTNFDDTTGYTALGGGALIPVYTHTEPSGRLITISVDLRFLYWFGGEANYLREGSIGRDNGTVTYDVIRSKTDMTTAHLGVAVNF
ncbi:MAG: hypothetical protein ACYC9O_13515 [Candidatus Latescibacterota bacterium]